MASVRVIGWAALANIVTALAQIAQLFVLTRLLVPADFGLMAIASSFAVIVLVFQDFGLSAYLIHAQDMNQHQQSSLYWLTAAMGCLVALVTAALAWPFALFYQQPDVADLLYVYAFNFILIGLFSQFQAQLQKHFRFRELALVDISSRVVGLLCACVSAWVGAGALAIALGLAATSLWRLLLLFGRFPEYRPQLVFERRSCGPALRYGGFQVGAQIISQLSGQLDSLILGRLVAGADLGLYALSKDLSIKVSGLVNPVIQKVGMPHLASIQGDREQLLQVYSRYVRAISAINAFIYALVAVFSVPLVMLVFGAGYERCAALLCGLCLFGYCRCVLSSIGFLLQATGRTRLDFRWNLVAIGLSTAATFLGAQFGVMGVVASNSVLMALFLPLVWAVVIRYAVNIGFLAYVRLFFVDLLLLAGLLALWFAGAGPVLYLAGAVLLTGLALRAGSAAGLGKLLFFRKV